MRNSSNSHNVYELVKDFTLDWPSAQESFLGTGPLEDAPALLIDRSEGVIAATGPADTADISTCINQLIEKLEPYASSFQAQSISIILDELSTNAIHHSGSSSSGIKIICQRAQDKGIAVTVVDEGGKLPVTQIKELFKERTIPVSPRNDPSRRGAGLGLFFCREFSSGIFIHLIEGSSTAVTCFVPYRPSKKSTLVIARIVRKP